MNYKELIKSAIRQNGSEDMMWKSVEFFSDMLEKMKETNPNEYWRIMRAQSELMYGRHYSEDFARHDVEGLEYEDRDGHHCTGEHWTMEEVIDATENDDFDSSVTDGDKYVALNVIFSDLCNVLDDDKIIEVALTFFFKDPDWGSPTKIWDYVGAKFK